VTENAWYGETDAIVPQVLIRHCRAGIHMAAVVEQYIDGPDGFVEIAPEVGIGFGLR
jgi:hypothetical protein